jgi:hypothetical protein
MYISSFNFDTFLILIKYYRLLALLLEFEAGSASEANEADLETKKDFSGENKNIKK